MLFALLASSIATPQIQARAMVRIVPAVRVAEEWKIAPRRRVILMDEKGRPVAVRLVEFE